VFTTRQHQSKSLDGKISKSFCVRWRQLARTRQPEKQIRPGRGFFFPSRQKWKFKETSAKQGSHIFSLPKIKQ